MVYSSAVIGITFKKSSAIVIGSSYTSSILNIFTFLIEINIFPNFVAETNQILFGANYLTGAKKPVTFFLSFFQGESFNNSSEDARYHDVCSIVFFAI